MPRDLTAIELKARLRQYGLELMYPPLWVTRRCDDKVICGVTVDAKTGRMDRRSTLGRAIRALDGGDL